MQWHISFTTHLLYTEHLYRNNDNHSDFDLENNRWIQLQLRFVFRLRRIETVEGAARPLERVDDFDRGDGLARVTSVQRARCAAAAETNL